jgi:hypothetical protein
LGVSDPREGYLSLISLEKSHINLSPPIVFLFGGAIEDSPKSVRGILYNHILVKDSSLFNCLVIPEDFKDWLHDSVYPDLLSFESDLAQTSSLIIIALESPGSIAELGSFSVNSALKDKIIIIISEHHHSQSSFITLGPLRQLPEVNVYSYPYNHKSIDDSLNDYLDDIVDSINENLSSIDKTERFDTGSNGHVALLIYELLLLFKALKFSEILSYLMLLNCERNKTITKRLLFLLSKLSLIDKKRIGNVDYYLPLRSERRINFSSKDKSKLFDRNSAIIGTAQYYASSQKEKMRRRAIEKLEAN